MGIELRESNKHCVDIDSVRKARLGAVQSPPPSVLKSVVEGEDGEDL